MARKYYPKRTIGHGREKRLRPYYTVVLGSGPTKWHATTSSGPFAHVTRGVFRSAADARAWARSHVGPFGWKIKRVTDNSGLMAVREENPLNPIEKKVLIGVAAAGVVAAVFYALTKQPAAVVVGKAPIATITPASGGQTINAKIGDTIAVQMPAPAAGYIWDGGPQGASIFTYGSPIVAADGSVMNQVVITATGNGQLAFAQYDSTGNPNPSTEVLVTVVAS